MSKKDKFAGPSDIYEEGDWSFYGVDEEFYLYNKVNDTSLRMDRHDAFNLLSLMCKAHYMLTYGWDDNEGE